jgi:cell wall-associated NlpC family hydrolase
MNLTPTVKPSHWSAALVGKPFKAGAEGPDEFDCWGLVMHVQAMLGRSLPRLAVNVREAPRDQWATIRELVQRSDWHKVERPQDGDVLLMIGANGLPHVGVVIGNRLLHAEGDDRTGSVRSDPLDMLGRMGYGHLEAWRHS